MVRYSLMIGVLSVAVAGAQPAPGVGTAAGKGVMDTGKGSLLFQPHFSYAYTQTVAGMRFTWIVLTEKLPPAKTLVAAKDQDEARREWCEKEKTPVAAVQLNSKGIVNQYMTCAANGGVNTEMLSSWNGLESVVLKFDARDAMHLKGSMKTGSGACSGPGGTTVYCKPTGDYTFDAPFVK